MFTGWSLPKPIPRRRRRQSPPFRRQPGRTSKDCCCGGLRLAIEPLGRDASIVWDAGAQRRPPRPRLDVRALGRDHAQVEFLGRSVELGRRHSEIVVLLALSPRGLSGEELARELYGSSGSRVTGRAEIVRLRRRLGRLVASQPYRLMADVHADFLEVEWLARRGRWRRPWTPMRGLCCPARRCPRSRRREGGWNRPARGAHGATTGRPRLQPPCNPCCLAERRSAAGGMLAMGCPRQRRDCIRWR